MLHQRGNNTEEFTCGFPITFSARDKWVLKFAVSLKQPVQCFTTVANFTHFRGNVNPSRGRRLIWSRYEGRRFTCAKNDAACASASSESSSLIICHLLGRLHKIMRHRNITIWIMDSLLTPNESYLQISLFSLGFSHG